MKLWGGRFETGPSGVFERFSGSLHFDKRLLDADIQGSQAFARALERAGILTADERRRIVDAFDAIREEARQPGFFDGATDEDVHTLVIRKLKENAGEVADKIHTGRSRNEQVSLDTRLWLRAACDTANELLRGLMSALLDLGEKYPAAVVPGYTHMRRAQAVLWPHYLLAYFEMFLRDAIVSLRPPRSQPDAAWIGRARRQRLQTRSRGDGKDLDFEVITANSMDVSADRDFALDFLYAASVTMLHLSRLAEDWIIYSSEEFGWLELGDGVTSGSSLMPQKKNPDSLELIRGKCGRVIGALNSLMITMKGLPMTYNRDMQEDKEPLFEAADQLTGCLEMAREVVGSVILKPQVPLEAAKESWVVATDLAEALARAGMPFHQAHKLIGRLVLESVKEGKEPQDWNAEALQAFAPEFTAEIAAMLATLLDPREGMKSREIPGGTGPAHVHAMLAARRALLEKMRT